MSQRPGVLTTARVSVDKGPNPWEGDGLPDIRSQVPFVTAEVRAHWPYFATREQAVAALQDAYGQALDQINEWFKEHQSE